MKFLLLFYKNYNLLQTTLQTLTDFAFETMKETGKTAWKSGKTVRTFGTFGS